MQIGHQQKNSKDETKTYSRLQIGQPEIQFYRLDKDKFKSATRTATNLNSTDWTKKNSSLQKGQPQIQFYRLDINKFNAAKRTTTNSRLQIGHRQIQRCK